MKHRLVIGTINAWQPDDEWLTWTLDIQPRGIWDPALDMTVQPDFVMDMRTLADFRADMWDEVRAAHVLEHVNGPDGARTISEVHRILKPGGQFDIEVPDLDRVCHAYVSGQLDADGARQWLLGEQLANHADPDTHRFLWTESELRYQMNVAGFQVGDREETGLALRLVGVKA